MLKECRRQGMEDALIARERLACRGMEERAGGKAAVGAVEVRMGTVRSVACVAEDDLRKADAQ